MANGRSSLIRRATKNFRFVTWQSYIALCFSTFFFGTHILPQHVTGVWVKGLGLCARLVSVCLGVNTCVQPPPSNIRYLLASGIFVNRF
ncbi:hypothetical protein E4T44_06958 [Aureobasidium sp. EXF-8845]|nr:hypothetical protein E4T44_06958 [Aureobasidium sp. EXF-8845]KAI4848482.1 hypothetical protein E4T45_06325 [Aureobasidium sp. EXF-8846]